MTLTKTQKTSHFFHMSAPIVHNHAHAEWISMDTTSHKRQGGFSSRFDNQKLSRATVRSPYFSASL